MLKPLAGTALLDRVTSKRVNRCGAKLMLTVVREERCGGLVMCGGEKERDCWGRGCG